MTGNRSTQLLIVALAAGPLLLLNHAAALAAKKLLTDIPLQWRPTEQSEMAQVNPGGVRARVRLGSFVDSRERPELVGECREDEDQGKVYQVTTSGRAAV